MIGRKLGDYRITQLIAEGGMSLVFRAERVDGSFDRSVAIKVCPASVLDRRLRDRFYQEQGVLASLNHGGITQLFDAAVTEEGWPYIVMELIDGLSIVDYVTNEKLGIRQRLSLMAEVVDAIAFAHGHLVVHRDIKPSNVLVNSEGRVKVLDFGIAKLLESERTRVTEFQAMTPRYASPEQLLGKPISVASDIYQLGVLLLEVLTGKAPSETSLTSAIERAAAGRSMELDPYTRRTLPGDVVLVVEQCLRYDPQERYRDAGALKSDLISVCTGYPVSAAAQSGLYRFRKFIARNRAASAIALLALMLLSTSSIWYTMQLASQRDEAERQTALALQSMEFLAGMFEASNPDVAQGAQLSAADLLDIGSERIKAELDDQPEAQVQLYLTIVTTLYRLGELERADALLGELLPLSARLGEGYAVEKIRARILQGMVKVQRGDNQEALALYVDIVRDAEETLGSSHPQSLAAKHNMAMALWNIGELREASEVYHDVYQQRASTLGPAHEATLTTAINLANLYRSLGTEDYGLEFIRTNHTVAENALGPLHGISVSLLNLLAMSTYVVDGVAASIPHFEEVLRRRERILGPEAFDTARSRARLGTFLAEVGDIERGKELQQRGIETMIDHRGELHPRVLSAKTNYAETLSREGRHRQVLEMLPPVIAKQEEKSGPGHPDTLYSKIVLADAMAEAGDPAAEKYTAVLEHSIVGQFGQDHWLYEALSAVTSKAQRQVRR